MSCEGRPFIQLLVEPQVYYKKMRRYLRNFRFVNNDGGA